MIRHSKLGMGAVMMAISAIGMMLKGVIVLAFAFPQLAVGSSLEAAVGLLSAALAWYGIRTGQMWAWSAAVAAFALIMIAALPGAAFNDMEGNMLAMGAVMYAAGALIAFRDLRSQRSCCLRGEAGSSSAG